jgi:antirestriction protein ArdC
MSALSKITKDALTVLKNKIVEGLKTDGLKWFKSFKGIGSPANALTQKNYKGINFWALGINKKENNYATIYYATKKAWQSVGATIKDGQSQNGTAVFYYGVFKKSVKNNKNEDKDKQFSFLKISYVYNYDQMNFENSTYTLPPKKENEVVDINQIENFVANIKGLELKHSSKGKCYYSPLLDYVHMTEKTGFFGVGDKSASFNYYSVLFHELSHWTGHKSRTARFEKNVKYFKDDTQLEYALEELVAEISANMLCMHFGLDKTINQNSIAYLKSWISRLQNDDKFLLKALSQSAGASTYLLENSTATAQVTPISKVA